MGKPIGNRGMGETERERNMGRGMRETEREQGNGGMRETERGIDQEGEGKGNTKMGEGNRPRGRGEWNYKFNLILVKSGEGSFEGLTRECELPFFFMSSCESLMRRITYGNINLCFSLL